MQNKILIIIIIIITLAPLIIEKKNVPIFFLIKIFFLFILNKSRFKFLCREQNFWNNTLSFFVEIKFYQFYFSYFLLAYLEFRLERKEEKLKFLTAFISLLYICVYFTQRHTRIYSFNCVFFSFFLSLFSI
jgi:hypothetical protein